LPSFAPTSKRERDDEDERKKAFAGRRALIDKVKTLDIRTEDAMAEGNRLLVDMRDLNVPILGPQLATTRGVVERWYDGRRPKTKTHLYEADGPLLGWFRNVYSSTVIIVEDLASALAVSLHTRCTGVALCGTSLSSEGANELRGRGYNARTLICLDRDATERAADLRQKWAAVIGGTVRVVPLRKDIKDMRPADIKFW
jgi:hypothetical protein